MSGKPTRYRPPAKPISVPLGRLEGGLRAGLGNLFLEEVERACGIDFQAIVDGVPGGVHSTRVDVWHGR